MKQFVLCCAFALACLAGERQWQQGKLAEASGGGKTNYSTIKARKIFTYIIESDGKVYQAEDKALDMLPVKMESAVEFAVEHGALYLKAGGKVHKLVLIRTAKKEQP